jgi:hypothetical protein
MNLDKLPLLADLEITRAASPVSGEAILYYGGGFHPLAALTFRLDGNCSLRMMHFVIDQSGGVGNEQYGIAPILQNVLSVVPIPSDWPHTRIMLAVRAVNAGDTTEASLLTKAVFEGLKSGPLTTYRGTVDELTAVVQALADWKETTIAFNIQKERPLDLEKTKAPNLADMSFPTRLKPQIRHVLSYYEPARKKVNLSNQCIGFTGDRLNFKPQAGLTGHEMIEAGETIRGFYTKLREARVLQPAKIRIALEKLGL